MSATTRNAARKRNNQRGLTLEHLEGRDLMSLTSAVLAQGVLSLAGNQSDSNVTVSQSGSNIVVKDLTNGFARSFTATQVQKVQFVGGAGRDRFVDNVFSLPCEAWGKGGNDYLEGYNGADKLVGGDGNDTLKGYGGNDQLWGEGGNDWLYGMAGDDFLYGGGEKDYLDGGANTDFFDGGVGFDTCHDDFDLNAWVRGGYSRFDIIQGRSGTCVINAAMAEAADGVNLSADVTHTGYNYSVRLVDGGRFVYQSVYFDGTWNDNDSCPGQSRNSDGTATGKNNGEFWTLLYQRAFLSLCGTNTGNEDSSQWTSNRYDFRDHQRALYAMSGWTTSARTIASNQSTQTAATMRQAILSGDLLTAGGTGHAYGVVDVYQENGTWKVKLYNPWGSDATHQKMSFANGTRSNDGEIIVDWNTFRANFTRVYTADR